MYYYGYGIDYTYILVIIGFLITLGAQIFVKSSYSKYKKINTKSKLDGFEVARKIQKGVVHYKYGIARPQFNTFGCARPATEVGGDFYDIFFLDDKKLCMIMGDVSGKGVTAALFMMIVKYAIKEKIKAGIGLADE